MTTVERVTARATRVLAPNPGPWTLDGTNTWVLREPGGERTVVVDPGPLDDGHLDRIVAQGPVELIVLTHGHDDHSEAAATLHERTGAPVTAHDPRLCIGTDAFRDNAVQDVAGLQWLTLLTPGHSSDSACFLLRADDAILTGDTILGRGTTVVAHPDGTLADYLESLHRLRDLADSDVEVLLPGHGPTVADPVGVLDYYLSHREERLEQVRAAVAAGVTDAMAVVRLVYADVDPVLWPAAEKSVLAQLDYLAADREGRARRP